MEHFELRQDYSSKEIAISLGYANERALQPGVITPKDRNMIVLLVTLEKKIKRTERTNKIRGSLLTWIGQPAHKTDPRIINAEKMGEQIFLFFRHRYDSKFRYYGSINLIKHKTSSGQEPSVFHFRIEEFGMEEEHSKSATSDLYPPTTQRPASGNVRYRQDIFRKRVLNLWGHSCSVTSLKNSRLLAAAPKVLTASHIKPWRHSNDEERLCRYNGLLLTPNLDCLFDYGVITFQHNGGHIKISNALSAQDRKILNIHEEMALRKIFPENKEYLEYHNDCVFE